jgi:hypothetical protein
MILSENTVHRVSVPTEIVPRIWLTGGISRTHDFENDGDPFFLDERQLATNTT